MTRDLGERMRAAPGEASPPPLEALWADGRSRRRRRKLLQGAGVAAVALLVVGAAWIAGRRSAEEQPSVEHSPSALATSTTLSTAGARCQPGPALDDSAPSESAAAFVTTSSGRARTPVAVVARATVVRSWWLPPTTISTQERTWQHRIELEVTDPVKGAEVGERLVVFDAIGVSGVADTLTAAPAGISGATCHFFTVGDDVVVSLADARGDQVFELAGSSAFFLIERGRFAPALDAARRSLDWDGELMRQARELAPEPFLDLLRGVADGVEAEAGDAASWTVSPQHQPSRGGSTFTALVARLGCPGATGRVLRPGIELGDLRVVVTFTVELPADDGGSVACDGEGPVAVEVDLGEPLGTRTLLDGACADGAEADGTALCLPNGQRWPQ